MVNNSSRHVGDVDAIAPLLRGRGDLRQRDRLADRRDAFLQRRVREVYRRSKRVAVYVTPRSHVQMQRLP